MCEEKSGGVVPATHPKSVDVVDATGATSATLDLDSCEQDAVFDGAADFFPAL